MMPKRSRTISFGTSTNNAAAASSRSTGPSGSNIRNSARAPSTQPQRPPSRSHGPRAATANPSGSIAQNDPAKSIKLASSTSRPDAAAGEAEGANIKVVVRCRGMSDMEKAMQGVAGKPVLHTGGMRGSELTVTVGEERDEERRAFPLGPSVGSALNEKTPTTKTYPFDHVFGPEADQALIYNDVVSSTVKEVISGYNCTIFAYGQTGTGKTYTMSGDLSPPAVATATSAPAALLPSAIAYSEGAGIIPRALHHLFSLLESEQAEYAVRVSFVELYNEELRDLNAVGEPAAPSGTSGPMTNSLPSEHNSGSGFSTSHNLKIFDDASRRGAVVIQGLEETPISSAAEGIKVLKRGSARRQMAATRCNEQSSRSHSVFSVSVHVKESASMNDAGSDSGASPSSHGRDIGIEDMLKIGKLNLVDLAGSENVGRSGAGKEGGRAREAGMINQSLLTLGRVINALVEKNGHVPYRESKLTRLLRDSLGGHTKTCIIATVSPARLSLEETLSTLDYALRAKTIRNRPELNARVTKHALINQYVQEVERLKLDLIAARERNGIFLSQESWQDLSSEHEARRLALEEAMRQREVYEHQVATARDQFEQSLRLLGLRETELKRVSEELARTTATLQDAQGRVTQASQCLEEERLVSSAYEDSRKSWKSWALDAEGDVEGLRAKIARKAAVELANQDTISQATGAFSAMTSELDLQIRKFRTNFDDYAIQMTQDLSSFAAAQCAELAANQQFINDHDKVLTAEDKQIAGHLNSLQSNLEAYQAGVAQIRDAMLEVNKEFSTAISSHVTTTMQDLGHRWTTFASQTTRRLSATLTCAESLSSLVSQRLVEDTLQLVQAQSGEAEALKEENARLRSQLQVLEARLESENVQDQEDAAEIVALITKHNRERSQRRRFAHSSLVAHLDAEQRSAASGRAERLATLTTLEERAHELRGIVTTELTGVAAETTQQLQDVDAHMQASEVVSQGHQNTIAELSNGHTQEVKAMATALCENQAKAEKSAAVHRSLLKQSRQILCQGVQKANATLQAKLGSANVSIDTSMQNALEQISTQQALAHTFVSASSAHLGNLAKDMQTYMSTEIKRDIPTGSTPRKRPLLQETLDLDNSRAGLLLALKAAQPAPEAAPTQTPGLTGAPAVSGSVAHLASTLPPDQEEFAKPLKPIPKPARPLVQRGGILREKAALQGQTVDSGRRKLPSNIKVLAD